jgi:hypothetical protein
MFGWVCETRQGEQVTYACQQTLVAMLRNGVDLAGNPGSENGVGRCMLWDVAVAVWAVNGDETASTKSNKRTAQGMMKDANWGDGKGMVQGKRANQRPKRWSETSLNKACVMHAPSVAGNGGGEK